MKEIRIKDSILAEASQQGADEFLKAVTAGIKQAAGETITKDTMESLNTGQMTLLAYDILHEEVMDGGFVQLIHNGYGAFIFLNPFAKIMKDWGISGLSKLIFKGKKLYYKYHSEIEKDCSDDEFMALFEKYPEFDEIDDEFVENEEEWTTQIALYVDEHIDDFVTIEK